MKTLLLEREHAINGVSGRMKSVEIQDDENPTTFSSQKWISETRSTRKLGYLGNMFVTMRFDDACKNGQNSFAITAKISSPDGNTCGYLHNEIAVIFPELQPFLQWHLVDTRGPLHYIANTLFHASDRDCYGLRAGERAAIVSWDGSPRWTLEAINDERVLFSKALGEAALAAATVPLYLVEKEFTGETPPPAPILAWKPLERVGKGKERDLESARISAVWPEAADEELLQDPAVLQAVLERRLPALISAFKEAIVGAGFLWERVDPS